MSRVTVGEGFVSLNDLSAKKAADALVDDALAGRDIDPDIGILFCTSKTDLDGFAGRVYERLAAYDAEMVGCTTAGEISKAGSTRGGAVLLLIESDAITFHTASASGVYDDPVEAGKQASEPLKGLMGKAPYTCVMAFVAGITFEEPGQDFDVLRGITEVVDPEIPVVGGSAGDDVELNGTYQFHNGEIFDDGVVLCGIASQYPIRTGEADGLSRTIASGVINETDGRVIKTVSGRPAAAFYADAIGVSVQELAKPFSSQWLKQARLGLRYLKLKLQGRDPVKITRVSQYAFEHALAVSVGQDDKRIMFPMDVTDDWGLVMASPVTETQMMYVMEGDRTDIIAAGKDAFAAIPSGENALFGVVADCTCRGQLLDAAELNAEVELLREAVDCPIIGFYGYGEIGGTGHYTTYRNQTVSGFVVTDGGDEDI